NLARVAELTKLGRMAAAGLQVFEERDRRKAAYSYEEEHSELDPRYEKTFRANAKAWAFFMSTPPGYRKLMTHWVMWAKKEETRARRLATLIETSAKGERIGLLKK
ncbi:MAG TPA: YdeI/OmpD-associated family protein, partial [Thermoanaerobaculia bacterium]|nr:YdeI/OmpD-associated family protein [Thermoanaerobaculia bacterium]